MEREARKRKKITNETWLVNVCVYILNKAKNFIIPVRLDFAFFSNHEISLKQGVVYLKVFNKRSENELH